MKPVLRIFPFACLLASAALLLSCVGGPRPAERPPVWFSSPPPESPRELFFQAAAGGGILSSARDAAVDSVIDSVLGEMNIGDPALWNDKTVRAVNVFREILKAAIRTPEFSSLEGMTVLAEDGWKNPEGKIFYAVSIAWEKQAFADRAGELAVLTGAGGPEYRDFERRGREAEIAGNIYESALIWAAAAGAAWNNGDTPDYRRALKEVGEVLEGLEYTLVSAPPEVYVDTPPEQPVVFQVLSGEKPVGNAEFVVSYPRAAEDGSPEQGKIRVVSDSEGRVIFLPPAVSFDGRQSVGMAPSADPFLKYLDAAGDSYADALIVSLETPRIDAVYPSRWISRTVPTGILILETDLAGNPLNSTAASGGLADDLIADGFNISVMDLDTPSMMEGGGLALLSKLKADNGVSKRFRRVIHGKVSLESFERDGDTYTVRVSGTLSLSDINREITVHQAVITKTSRAGDGQQAMSAAFRQLGRSFAAELIEQAP